MTGHGLPQLKNVTSGNRASLAGQGVGAFSFYYYFYFAWRSRAPGCAAPSLEGLT